MRCVVLESAICSSSRKHHQLPLQNALDIAGKLQIAITVERESGTGLIALAGRIVGGIRSAVTGARENNVTMSYVREFAASPVVVDKIDVQLGQLESGRYRVTLRVTDVASGTTLSRVQRFAIDRSQR